MTPAPAAVRSIKSAVDAATRRLTGTVTESPRLDAEVLMAFALGWTRARLFAHWDEPLPEAHFPAYESHISRRAAGEPVAYIRNLKEFLGLDLYVDPRVLIPRPETELLVTRAIALLESWTARQPSSGNVVSPEHPSHVPEIFLRAGAGTQSLPGCGVSPQNSSFNGGVGRQPLVVDVGTGSGAVAIGIKMACSEAEVIATDISKGALAVAALNATKHQVTLDLRQGCLLEPLAAKVDLIVANLPYLSKPEYESLQATSIAYEPRIALTDEHDGLRLFDQLLAQAKTKLNDGGAILLEIGSAQPAALQRLANTHLPRMQPTIFADYAGLPRVLQLM